MNEHRSSFSSSTNKSVQKSHLLAFAVSLLMILFGYDRIERLSKERVLYVRFGTCLPTRYVYNFDKTLEGTFGTVSVVSLSRPLMTSTHRLTRRLGIIVPLCRRKLVPEERSNGTIVLALLSVQSFASITLFDD